VAVRRQQERGVGSAGRGGKFSRWACFPASTGQWDSAEGGQSQKPGTREPRGFLCGQLNTADCDCALPTAAARSGGSRESSFLDNVRSAYAYVSYITTPCYGLSYSRNNQELV
jgi:hypothetical protein